MATGLAIVSAIAAVVGTAASIHEQRKFRKEQARANRVKQSMAEVKNRRNRLAQIRAYREQAATAANAGNQRQGGGTSSANQGTIGSLGSQLSDNLGFLNSQQVAADQIFSHQQKSQSSADRGAAYGAVGKLGWNNGGKAALTDAVTTIFGD